jgi:predicted amidohydrolase YtcJ
VEQIDPLLGIYAAVTRRPLSGDYAPDGWYAEQKLTMEEAVRAFTEATAVTSGQAHKLGTITAGKLADLTVFDRDLFTIDPEEIRQTKVIGTLVDGVFKHRTF